MNATKRSKSINLCVYIFLFITNILAEQDSISIQIPIDSISHNKEELSADIIDSIDTLFIDKINDELLFIHMYQIQMTQLIVFSGYFQMEIILLLV